LISLRNTKLVFFLGLLISAAPPNLNGQVSPGDTLKKVSADTVAAAGDEGGELEERVNYSAEDSVVTLPGQSRVILYGKAKVEYGTMIMDAEHLDINYGTNIVKAYGKLDSAGRKKGTPQFKDGGETMEADTIKYNLKTKKGKIYNAMTKQGELLVMGSEIKKDSNDVTYFRNMRCLPCQEEDARTAFIATRAKVIPDDKIVTGPMYLEIGGVPTPLGLPFGYFPNTRKQHNGILLPTFGVSPGQGFNLRQGGFYWGISDKADMIIRGDIYANGSWMLGATNNYNVLYRANGSTFVSYSEFNIGDKDIPDQFSKEKSYAVEWRHTQDNRSNPSVRFSANVNFRNNQNFNRLNAVNSGQFLQNTFQSNVNYTKSWKAASLSLNALHSQNSLTRVMEIVMPALTFNVNRFFPFKRQDAVRQNVFDKIGVSYMMEARNTLRGGDSTIFSGSLLDSLSHGVRHTLPISTNFNVFKYITMTPRIGLNGYTYSKTVRKDFIAQETGKDFVYTRNRRDGAFAYDATFSTDAATQVYFDYHFLRGKMKQIRHLLIPTLTYSYRPDFGEEQFGVWKTIPRDSLGNTQRYSIFEKGIFGGPQPGKTNALGISLNNNIESKIRQKTDTGITFRKVVLLQNLTFNGSYNFAADSFKMSLIGISARTVLFRYLDIVAFSSFDPYRYDKGKQRTVNAFSYNYDGRLARLTDVQFTVGSSIGSDMLEARRKLRQPPDQTNGAERGGEANAAAGGALPWNLRMNYNLSLANRDDRVYQPTQALSFSGDLMPTKYWRIGVTSGFDFQTQKISYTSVNIYRDLKCWEARIDWIPFGIRKSYAIAINLKTSMLSEFKIPRQRQWYDNMQ
jgi:hypothetical protein